MTDHAKWLAEIEARHTAIEARARGDMDVGDGMQAHEDRGDLLALVKATSVPTLREAMAYSDGTKVAAQAIARLAADPALRAAFNAYPGLSPRLTLTDGDPGDRGRYLVKFCAEYDIAAADVATALRVPLPAFQALLDGKRTTDDAGWREVMTAVFLVGGGMKAEEIADPVGSGALDRALVREESTGLDVASEGDEGGVRALVGLPPADEMADDVRTDAPAEPEPRD